MWACAILFRETDEEETNRNTTRMVIPLFQTVLPLRNAFLTGRYVMSMLLAKSTKVRLW